MANHWTIPPAGPVPMKSYHCSPVSSRVIGSRAYPTVPAQSFLPPVRPSTRGDGDRPKPSRWVSPVRLTTTNGIHVPRKRPPNSGLEAAHRDHEDPGRSSRRSAILRIPPRTHVRPGAQDLILGSTRAARAIEP